jgi:hypothetical protein
MTMTLISNNTKHPWDSILALFQSRKITLHIALMLENLKTNTSKPGGGRDAGPYLSWGGLLRLV